MAFPALIRAALDKVGYVGLPGRTTDQAGCEGSVHHSPSPLLVQALDLGGVTTYLCGVCADNLAVYRHLVAEHNGDVPWPIRRCFGNRIRALAERTSTGATT